MAIADSPSLESLKLSEYVRLIHWSGNPARLGPEELALDREIRRAQLRVISLQILDLCNAARRYLAAAMINLAEGHQ